MNWKFWKPSCNHVFESWHVTHRWANPQAGVVKIAQSRTCTVCGLTQIKTEMAG